MKQQFIGFVLGLSSALLICREAGAQVHCEDGCTSTAMAQAGGSGLIAVSFIPGAGNDAGTCRWDCTWDPCAFVGEIRIHNFQINSVTVELFDPSGTKQEYAPGKSEVPPGQAKNFPVALELGCGQTPESWPIKNLDGGQESAAELSCSVCPAVPE